MSIKHVTTHRGFTRTVTYPAPPTKSDYLLVCVKQLAMGAVIALAITFFGVVTGCTMYVFDKLEQDIATSTIEPRLSSLSVNQDDLDDNAVYQASKQYQNSKHANNFLASQRGVE